MPATSPSCGRSLPCLPWRPSPPGRPKSPRARSNLLLTLAVHLSFLGAVSRCETASPGIRHNRCYSNCRVQVIRSRQRLHGRLQAWSEGSPMSSDLASIVIDCDALPYGIVKMCEQLGFRTPLDVRWCRLSRFLKSQRESVAMRRLHALVRLLGLGQPQKRRCSCGHPLPTMEGYTFVFSSEEQADRMLGQCPCCRTMFWDVIGEERQS